MNKAFDYPAVALRWCVAATPVAASLIFVLLVLFSFDRFYLTNDNVAIFENAYAGYSVRYVSALWSFILCSLQQFAPLNAVSIYAVGLYFAHFIGISLFFDSLRHLDVPRYLLVCVLIPYLAFYAGFLIFLDYTSASIMLGAQAIMAFAVRWKGGIASISFTVLCAVLLMFAGMIRIKGGVALLVISCPFLFLIWLIRIRSSEPHEFSLRSLALPMLLVIPLLTMIATDWGYKKFQAPESYIQYEKFNQLRGPLHNDLDKATVLQANINNSQLLTSSGWKN